MVFNLSKQAGPRRIKDRGINWKEYYHERSVKLKNRFDKQLPGAYRRWEGHDYTSDGDYFVVVGPARTKELKKRFFAGIKRYPKDKKVEIYAPYGEYFSTLTAALSHASTKWAIPFPKGQPNFSVTDLENVEIPRHVRG